MASVRQLAMGWHVSPQGEVAVLWIVDFASERQQLFYDLAVFNAA